MIPYIWQPIALVIFYLLSVASASAAQECERIYPATDGWAVDVCLEDASFPKRMEVVLDGTSKGRVASVRVYHETDDGASLPQVAVFNASGFVRLKQNADPVPPIPFGSSFVLGPAYWSDAVTYHHSPSLSLMEIDIDDLPHGGPLRLTAKGHNGDFDLSYAFTLPPPRDRRTRLHVHQEYRATEPLAIDSRRLAEHEGLKLVQVSSMYINEGESCEGGHFDCHDSDSVRYIGSDGARRQVALADLTPSAFVFAAPPPLGTTWLDVLHSDDANWQGNTPTVRIALNALPTEPERTITPQGYITATTDPNDDNLNLWLHDDDPEVGNWAQGQGGEISYWLLAQDDTPDPWSALDLRPGTTLLDFENAVDCRFVHDPGQGTSGSVEAIAGYADRALELRYDLAGDAGNWTQLRCDFDQPQDLSAYDHLRFEWRGDAASANSLDVALVSRSNAEDKIFSDEFRHVSQRAWWGQLIVPFSSLKPWPGATIFNPSQVTAFFVSVVKKPKDSDSVEDSGGAGGLAIDNIGFFNVVDRDIPSVFEEVPPNAAASTRAVDWLAGQQQSTGLLKSWEQDTECFAYTYDQALALLAFIDAGRRGEADALVDALASTQNPNGSWFELRDCLDLTPVAGNENEWEGAIAWAVFALNRYLATGGTHPDAASARNRAADWLLTRIDPGDGCLAIDHTEGTIDAWWALAYAGNAYVNAAYGLRDCLLRHYWNPYMGRFKGGRDWWRPYLDNQTWGGAFLQAIGTSGNALRALSYARAVLRLPAQGGQLFGQDGEAGPWSVWNEGSGQYVALGGEGAAELVDELVAQQRPDGAIPGSPDDFSGGGVWTTRWYGVAPTAWLYFALNEGPFLPSGPFSNFIDVAPNYWAWASIQTLFANGITGGCGGNRYCPDNPVTRAQMAVFLERGMRGSGYLPPPATGTLFSDVPADHWAGAWIEQLWQDNITSGCGGDRYCPDAPVTRAQMAVFLLRAKHWPAVYTPPPATGTLFSDVPADHWAGAWIEQLWRDNITSGCGGDRYCPDAPVTRAQMAVFLTRTFDLR